MTGKGTTRRSVRVSDDQWDAFDETVKQLGTDRSAYLLEVIRWANGEPDAEPPRRPERP